MTPPRNSVIVCRNVRKVRKWIRGYLAELNDSELADAIGAAQQPVALALVDGALTNRPQISADGTLCAWSLWYDMLDKDELVELMQRVRDLQEAAATLGIPIPAKVFRGNTNWKAAIGWTDRVALGGM